MRVKKQKATLSRVTQANGDKQHCRPLRTLWEPLIRSRGRRAAQSLALHGSRVSALSHEPRSTACPEPSAARSGQKACGRRSARSISGRCKISRNLRKRLECGAAIGPPGRGLGRAGEGRSEEVDGKYEGVVWQRGLSFSSHPCQHSFSSFPLLSSSKSPPPTPLPRWPAAPPTHGP